MKHFYRIALLLFLPLFSIAQSNYKPGYVVTLKGDTLKGFIDYQEWDKNPTTINFKANLQTNGNSEKFSVENSTAFAVTGFEYYEQYQVSVSLGQTDVEKLSTGLDTSTKVSKIFLKLIAKGKNVNLYEYKDEIKNRFYIKEQSAAIPEELINRSYLNPDNITQMVTQPRYQNQLQQLAIKYGNDKPSTKVEYIESSLIVIVNKINGVEKKGNGNYTSKPVRFFGGAGITTGNLKYTGDTFLALEPTSKSSYGPKIDLGIDAFLNPNVGRLILRIELSFTMQELQTSSNTTPFASQSFRQFTTSFTPQLIYNVYNTEGLKFYVGAGGSINLTQHSNNYYLYNEYPSAPAKTRLKDYPNLASTGGSVMGRIGVVIHKKYEFYVAYIPSAIVTDHYGSFSGAVTSAQVGINYLFGKSN